VAGGITLAESFQLLPAPDEGDAKELSQCHADIDGWRRRLKTAQAAKLLQAERSHKPKRIETRQYYSQIRGRKNLTEFGEAT
jgi:hypothetical protein